MFEQQPVEHVAADAVDVLGSRVQDQIGGGHGRDFLWTWLREARSRQSAIAARLESAENRVKLRTLMSTERTDEALARFDQLERRVDYAEGRAEAIDIASGGPSLSDEIAALEGSDAIDDELAEMKKALGKPEAKKGE